MKKLPPWNSLLKNFPNHEASKVFTDIGGKVKLNYDIGVFTNACATRVSKALNFSGEKYRIPYFKTKNSAGEDVVQVSSGGKKYWYIFRVKALIEYLTQTYGNPNIMAPAGFKNALSGKKGIILFEVSGWSDASGHADLWDGNKVVGSDYGDKANRVYFWETV